MAAAPAAALQLVRGLHTLNNLMVRAKASMQAVLTEDVSARESTETMLGHTSELEATLLDISAITTTGQDWPQRWMARGAPAAADLHSANTRCAASFGAFITAATGALQRADVAIGAPQQMVSVRQGQRLQLFTSTWHLTSEVCDWFASWGPFLTSPVPIDLLPLHPTLNNLMAWMLAFVQRESFAQRTLQLHTRPGLQWQQAFYRCMNTVMLLLRVVYGYEPAELCRAVNALPPGLIATLCCLACEVAPRLQGPAGPQDRLHDVCVSLYTQLLRTLEGLIGRFVSARECLNCSVPLNPELVSPSTLEVVKRAVSVCYTTNAITPDFLVAAQLTLSLIMTYAPRAAIPQIVVLNTLEQHSSQGVSSNSDVLLIPSYQTPDHSLLSQMLRCSLKYPQSLQRSTAIMAIMVGKWNEQGAKGLSPHIAACLVDALRHCSHHMRRNIQQQLLEKHRRGGLSARQRGLTRSVGPISPEEMVQLQMLMLMSMAQYTTGVLHAYAGEWV